MSRNALHLAVYDLSAAREREKVAETLAGFGFRVQESVFELRLDPAGRGRLQRRLDALDLQTGFVLIYRLDERARRHHVGRLPAQPFAEDRHAYVV